MPESHSWNSGLGLVLQTFYSVPSSLKADPGPTDLGLNLGLCHLIALLLGQVTHLSV